MKILANKVFIDNKVNIKKLDSYLTDI